MARGRGRGNIARGRGRGAKGRGSAVSQSTRARSASTEAEQVGRDPAALNDTDAAAAAAAVAAETEANAEMAAQDWPSMLSEDQVKAAVKVLANLDLSGAQWSLLRMVIRLLQSNTAVPEKQVLFLAPSVYEDLVHTMHNNVLLTQRASGLRSKRNSSDSQDVQRTMPKVELELRRVLGENFTWQCQQQGQSEHAPPELMVFMVACSSSAPVLRKQTSEQQQQQQQHPCTETPHLSLLLLYNAEGLIREATLPGRAVVPDGVRKRGPALLLHLDPHNASVQPHPSRCLHVDRKGHPRCAPDVIGPEAKHVFAPVLAYFEAEINRIGRGMRANQGDTRGRPNSVQTLRLLGESHDFLKLYRGRLPPLLHDCEHIQAGRCHCHAAVLVAMEWLLACPINAEVIQQQACLGQQLAGLHSIICSSLWYPSCLAALMANQLTAFAGTFKQVATQLQQQQELEQAEQEQKQGPQLLKFEMQHIKQCWQRAQSVLQQQAAQPRQFKDRLGLSGLCYPGVPGCIALQREACKAQVPEHHIFPASSTQAWQQAPPGLAARVLLKQLEHCVKQAGFKEDLQPPGLIGSSSSRVDDGAESSAAAAARNACSALYTAAVVERHPGLFSTPISASMSYAKWDEVCMPSNLALGAEASWALKGLVISRYPKLLQQQGAGASITAALQQVQGASGVATSAAAAPASDAPPTPVNCDNGAAAAAAAGHGVSGVADSKPASSGGFARAEPSQISPAGDTSCTTNGQQLQGLESSLSAGIGATRLQVAAANLRGGEAGEDTAPPQLLCTPPAQLLPAAAAKADSQLANEQCTPGSPTCSGSQTRAEHQQQQQQQQGQAHRVAKRRRQEALPNMDVHRNIAERLEQQQPGPKFQRHRAKRQKQIADAGVPEQIEAGALQQQQQQQRQHRGARRQKHGQASRPTSVAAANWLQHEHAEEEAPMLQHPAQADEQQLLQEPELGDAEAQQWGQQQQQLQQDLRQQQQDWQQQQEEDEERERAEQQQQQPQSWDEWESQRQQRAYTWQPLSKPLQESEKSEWRRNAEAKIWELAARIVLRNEQRRRCDRHV